MDHPIREQKQDAPNRPIFQVRQIAIARWPIERLHTATNNVWNFALLDAASLPSEMVEEMEDAEAAVELLGRNSLSKR